MCVWASLAATPGLCCKHLQALAVQESGSNFESHEGRTSLPRSSSQLLSYQSPPPPPPPLELRSQKSCGTQLPAVYCFIQKRNLGCRLPAPCRCARASPVPLNTPTPPLIRLLPYADPAISPFTSPRRVLLELGASVTCVQNQSPRLFPADPRLSSSAGVRRPRRARPLLAPSAPLTAQPRPSTARISVALQHATCRAVWSTGF